MPPPPHPQGRPRRRPVLGGVTRYVIVPLLLVCAGIRIGMSVQRSARPAPATQAAAPAPRPPEAEAAAPAPTCELTGSFQDNIYPSLLLSFGTTYPEYTRCLTLALHGLPAAGSVSVRVDSSLFLRPLEIPVEGERGSASLNPLLPWNFELLRSVSQLQPESFVATVLLDGRQVAEATLVCSVHSVNEAVSRVYSPVLGQWMDTSVCFAAFVNEDHPWINGLLQEAVEKSGIRGFNGYQSGPQGALRQAQAVWDALAARGLSYVNVATDSGTSPYVSTQYVRFLDQSVRDQGANCVDASVMFASVLRRIGLRPVLLFRPGHCFTAFYDSADGGGLVAFETTYLGTASFASAMSEGAKELQSTLPFLGTSQYSIVDIAVCRQQGISPIPFRGADRG